MDSIKDLILKTQTQGNSIYWLTLLDWKTRLDSVAALFDFLDQNRVIFSQKSLTKIVDLSDTLCTLMTDPNAKIQ